MVSEIDRVAIVVPTLVRADRLEKCLKSIDEHGGPCHVRVYNNWTHSGVARVCREYAQDGRSETMHVTVENHPENLGCAASWNRGIKAFFEEGFDWVIVLNDDVEILSGTVEAFIDAVSAHRPLVWSPNESMSCFAIHRRVVDEIGWFDENFWPAYREDEDFTHRMKVAGIKPGPAVGAEVNHERSSSLNYSEFLWFQHRTRIDHQNLLYYGRKWGGVPHFERFAKPFNDHKAALAYWPDPKPRSWGLKLDSEDRVVIDNDKPFKVRLYGSFLSNGSFARVSRGLQEGLEDLGLLAGTVEVDGFSSDEMAAAPGIDATVGIYAGNPSFVSVMTSQGKHDMNFAVLAPNSTWLPERLVESVRERAAIVAPSSWGAEVLASHGLQKFPPLRHGISKAFRVMPESSRLLRQMFQEGQFRVLHLSSTEFDRKGTRELVSAWKRAVARGALGAKPRLLAIVDAPDGTYPEAANEPSIALTNRRLNATEEQMVGVYQGFHLVCQPSRGEGFGMVPLEARACGIPVLATDCTGHGEHMGGIEDGCVVIPTGELVPIDDGPGAMAPALRSEDIEEALVLAYSKWNELFEAARKGAASLRQTWSWSNQTKQWLAQMGLHGDSK